MSITEIMQEREEFLEQGEFAEAYGIEFSDGEPRQYYLDDLHVVNVMRSSY